MAAASRLYCSLCLLPIAECRGHSAVFQAVKAVDYQPPPKSAKLPALHTRPPCVQEAHGDPIGDDTMGRAWLRCARCGGEWLVDPPEPEPGPHATLIEQMREWADGLDKAKGWEAAALRAEVTGVIKALREVAADLERGK